MTRTAELRATLGALAILGLSLLLFAALNWQALAATVSVSQKNRTFQPNEVMLARADTLSIVNDDGELLHHAFVRDAGFTFDSGEQEPGTRLSLRFPRAGTYTVRCAIHPRMRLVVTVR